MTTKRMLAANTEATLCVAVVAHDAARLAQLQTIVREAGHRVVAIDAADVVLADARATASDKPALVLTEQPTAANQLPLDANAKQIDAALRAIAAGLSVSVARARRPGFEELPESAIHGLLTPRELDVLNAIGAGQGNKAIARELGISLHTVKFHIESLLRKLGARTRAEAVAKALERKIRETIDL